MLKLGRRARGHFMTLIEIRVHLIRVKPGHISVLPSSRIYSLTFLILHASRLPKCTTFLHISIRNCAVLFETHTKLASPLSITIGHFRITSGLILEASLGAHLFICKSIFIHMKMSLICV